MRRTCVALSVVMAVALVDAAEAAPRPRLKAFASCKQLVDYARAGALRTDGGAGVTPRGMPVPIDAITTPQIIAPREGATDVGGQVPTAAPVSGNAGDSLS